MATEEPKQNKSLVQVLLLLSVLKAACSVLIGPAIVLSVLLLQVRSRSMSSSPCFLPSHARGSEEENEETTEKGKGKTRKRMGFVEISAIPIVLAFMDVFPYGSTTLSRVTSQTCTSITLEHEIS